MVVTFPYASPPASPWLISSNLGRLFDTLVSLIGLYQEINYKAQNATRLEAIADPDERNSCEFPTHGSQLLFKRLFE